MKGSTLIYPEQSHSRQKPLNLQEQDQWLFDLNSYKSPTSELYPLTNVLVTSDGVVLKRLLPFKRNITLYEYDFIHYRYKYLFRSLLTYRKRTPRFKLKPLLFFDNYSDGFAHWIIDTLTRLVEVNDKLDQYTLLLPPYIEKFPYYRQTLKFFNIKAEYILPEKTIIYTPKLYIPSHMAPSGHFNAHNIDKLRSFITSKIATPKVPEKNIYISRGKATRRFVVNEAAVIQLMKELNFTVIVMEEYTFEEQVALIANAENVVSIHGAALSTIAFMKKGSQVLEFRKKNDNHNNVFYNLACAAEVNYYYQLCEATDISSSANNFNLTVDLAILKENVQLMINTSQGKTYKS